MTGQRCLISGICLMSGGNQHWRGGTRKGVGNRRLFPVFTRELQKKLFHFVHFFFFSRTKTGGLNWFTIARNADDWYDRKKRWVVSLLTVLVSCKIIIIMSHFIGEDNLNLSILYVLPVCSFKAWRRLITATTTTTTATTTCPCLCPWILNIPSPQSLLALSLRKTLVTR